jgi:DNA-directed RNA polymerase beta' subunit
VLAEAGDKVGKMAIENTSAAGSRLMDMIKSGSKGANKNVTQMAGCLAQQIVEGHLPPLSYGLSSLRTVRQSPEARGFIESSFLKG